MNKWVKDAIFYQIYPTSFYDSNNDGIGDLKGIIKKIDYLKLLKIDAIWLNPIFLSPFLDGGYDIEDYYKIDPRFGDMNDLKELIKVCHRNNIKIVLDLVIGHTSTSHKWFIESSKGERNKYSDYYIWTDSTFNNYKGKTVHGVYPRDGGYYVNFFNFQPALNFGFNNKDTSFKMRYDDKRLLPLKNEVINIIRFYLKMGIDGFRVDMAASIVKEWDENNMKGIVYVWHELLNPIRKEFPNALFISEWADPVSSIKKCGFDIDLFLHQLNVYSELFRSEKNSNLLPHLEKGHSYFKKDGLGDFSNAEKYFNRVFPSIKDHGYFSITSGSHDEIRLAQFKDIDELKVIFAFLLTFKHVPFIYYGDEIMMPHNFAVNKDGGYRRTGARTPMQWDDSKNRGFSLNNKTYLPTNKNKIISVKYQMNDKTSLFNLVKELIELRHKYSCLNADGEIKMMHTNYPTIYQRKDNKNLITVYLNPSNKKATYKLNNFKKELILFNCDIKNKQLNLLGSSFAIILNK